MLSPLRNRFGIPGVISVIALVFAMLGGAYAANDSGGGKATASAKGKPGPRGKTGKTGPAGPAGPAGPQGPAGANGAKGDTGAKGDKGDTGSAGGAGAPGKSVKITSIPLEVPDCNELGGIKVEVEGSGSPSKVCNGEEGPKGDKGEKGDPWSVGGTLPPGATETGAWAFSATEVSGEKILAPISFPIQLAAQLTGPHVHFQGLPTEAEFLAVCDTDGAGTGGSATVPTAKPGELCVYYNNSGGEADALFNATFTKISRTNGLENGGASRPGAILRFAFSGSPGERANGFGSWAVTGCSAALPEGDPNKCP